MKRVSVYENDKFVGWFDLDSAEEIGSYKWGSPYVSGKILLVTKGGKLIINDWNNSGYDSYRFAENEEEIAEILAKSGVNEEKLTEKLKEILKKYEL